jgi:hypothetical protein
MSIRLLAKDLYRMVQEVQKYEKQLAGAPLDQQAELLDQLRKAKAERDRLRRLLDGQKGD